MYSKSCSAASVNEARQLRFTQGSRSLENIPPTQAAVFEQAKRSYRLPIYGSRQSSVIRLYQTFQIGDGNLMETGGCHSGPN